MKNKRYFVLLLATSFLLAGCGEGSGDSTSATSETPSTSETSATSAPTSTSETPTSTSETPVVDERIKLTSETGLTEKDKGSYKEATAKNFKFNVLGHEASEGKFGTIKQKVYGNRDLYGYDYTYNGMVYNRSAISGFKSIEVKYTGDALKVVFSKYLMEDMSFGGYSVTSESKMNAPAGMNYFILHTAGTSTIESIVIDYDLDASIRSEFMFNESSTYGGARSLAKSKVFDDSTIEIENNPTRYTNNYSHGNHVSNDHDDSWYRWNGINGQNSADLGANFEFHMTVLGNISQAVDPNDYFNFSIWPQFKHGDVNPGGSNYHMIYFGNDNYEPLGYNLPGGGVNPNAINTNYHDTYSGRFFADYDPDWNFANPDSQMMPESNLTLRQGYERYTLPYWHVKFVGDAVNNNLKVYVNDILYLNEVIFDDVDEHDDYTYQYQAGEAITIKYLQMHLVNYGTGQEGSVDTPRESYKGVFTYPRIA